MRGYVWYWYHLTLHNDEYQIVIYNNLPQLLRMVNEYDP